MKPWPDPPIEPGAVAEALASKARRGPDPLAQASPDARDGSAISAGLGMRVRALRKQAGLTLNALSKRSGVSLAFLSAIERTAKSPTLPIVVRIADGLNVTMSSLLGIEPDAADVALHRRRDRVTFRDPETGFEREVLASPRPGGEVEIVLHRIPPGGSSGLLPAYATPTEKHVVVQEGELTVFVNEAAYRVRPGDALSFEIKTPYRLCNEGARACVYIVVMVRKG